MSLVEIHKVDLKNTLEKDIIKQACQQCGINEEDILTSYIKDGAVFVHLSASVEVIDIEFTVGGNNE